MSAHKNHVDKKRDSEEYSSPELILDKVYAVHNESVSKYSIVINILTATNFPNFGLSFRIDLLNQGGKPSVEICWKYQKWSVKKSAKSYQKPAAHV